MKTLTTRLLLPLLFTSLASADLFVYGVGGLQAGYVTDAAGSQLWPVWGSASSVSFGRPVTLPAGVSQIRLAPGQVFALATVGPNTTGMLYLKSGAVDRVAPIRDAVASPDWVAFSGGGKAALLYSSGTHRLQVLKDLPGTAQVAADLDAALLPEPPVMGAISDDGSLVVVASHKSVYRWSAEGASKAILTAAAIRSLTVLRNGKDVAISDAATASIYLVRDAISKPSLEVVASGLVENGSLFPSTDGQSLLVAQPGAAKVSSINLVSGDVRSLKAFVSPAGVTPVRDGETFVISAPQGRPGWVLYEEGSVCEIQSRIVSNPW